MSQILDDRLIFIYIYVDILCHKKHLTSLTDVGDHEHHSQQCCSHVLHTDSRTLECCAPCNCWYFVLSPENPHAHLRPSSNPEGATAIRWMCAEQQGENKCVSVWRTHQDYCNCVLKAFEPVESEENNVCVQSSEEPLVWKESFFFFFLNVETLCE